MFNFISLFEYNFCTISVSQLLANTNNWAANSYVRKYFEKIETYFFVIVKNVKYKIQGLWKLHLNIYIRISFGNGLLSETYIYSVT